MTPKQRAAKVYETYRQIVMSPPSKRQKEKSLVQLIADEIADAIKEDRKQRKRSRKQKVEEKR